MHEIGSIHFPYQSESLKLYLNGIIKMKDCVFLASPRKQEREEFCKAKVTVKHKSKIIIQYLQGNPL